MTAEPKRAPTPETDNCVQHDCSEYTAWKDYYSVDAEFARGLERERDALRLALEPFALFAERFDAKPLARLHDDLFGIHAGLPELEAYLRLSDCRNASAVLAKYQEGT